MHSIYNRPKTTATPAGEKLVTEYEMTIDETGHKSLTEKYTKKDIYTPIQESLEESKIENIIRRATAGDQSALHIHEGQYLDLRGAPTSLAEAQAAIVAAENDWLKLPVEIRAAFDHSFEKFVNEYGTESWKNTFKSYNQKNGIKSNNAQENETKEVTENES